MHGVTRFYHSRLEDTLTNTTQAIPLAVQTGSKRDEIVAVKIVRPVGLLSGDHQSALTSSERALPLA